MFRNLAYASVSAASAGLLLLVLVVAGRVLGDAEFGKFSFALALGSIFETLMDFGLHQATIRAVARDRSQASTLLHHSLGLKLVWASGAMVLLIATATVLRSEADVRLACYLLGGSFVLRSYMLTIRGVLQGLERFGWDSIVVVADRALLLACSVVALAMGAGLSGVVVAFVVARVIALALAGWITQTHLGGLGIRFERQTWWDLQTTALPLGAFLIVLNLYSYVDGVMLGVMRSDVETGFYTAAYRVYEGMSYAPSVIAAVLTPRLSGLFAGSRAEHQRLAGLGLAGSLALAVVLAAAGYAFSAQIVTLLFGPAFAAAAVPLRILCIGLVFLFPIWVLHAVAISVGGERLLLKTAVIGLVVNVGLNLYLIPQLGANGAAVATVVGEGVSLCVLMAGLWRRA